MHSPFCRSPARVSLRIEADSPGMMPSALGPTFSSSGGCFRQHLNHLAWVLPPRVAGMVGPVVVESHAGFPCNPGSSGLDGLLADLDMPRLAVALVDEQIRLQAQHFLDPFPPRSDLVGPPVDKHSVARFVKPARVIHKFVIPLYRSTVASNPGTSGSPERLK